MTKSIEPFVITDLEAARLLGLSRQAIVNMVNRGDLERIKIGRSARYRLSDVKAIAGLPS